MAGSNPADCFVKEKTGFYHHVKVGPGDPAPREGAGKEMKPHVSGYERGRNIVRVLVVLAIILGVAALMFTQENSREQMLLVIGSAACVVGVIVVARLLCVCPHYGKRIVSGVLVLRVCPKCRHDLLTGAKVKKQR